MAEPEYIGKIRFGAGPGCPCEALEGWRVVQAVKVHQAWPYYQDDGNMNCWLQLTSDGFGAASGVRLLDPWTGLSSGGPLVLPSGDFAYANAENGTFIPLVDSGTSERIGGHSLSERYSLAALEAHADIIHGNLAAHPLTLAPGRDYIAAVAETETSYRTITPQTVGGLMDAWAPTRHSAGEPDCVPYGLVPAPVDGRVVVSRGPGGRTPPQWHLQATYKRGSRYTRDRLLVGHTGYYSIETWVAGGLFGQTIFVAPILTWYRHKGGWLDIYAPHIPVGLEPQAEYFLIASAATVTLGGQPPGGVPVTETQGFGGGGGGC
jgi:hypothetical protein